MLKLLLSCMVATAAKCGNCKAPGGTCDLQDAMSLLQATNAEKMHEQLASLGTEIDESGKVVHLEKQDPYALALEDLRTGVLGKRRFLELQHLKLKPSQGEFAGGPWDDNPSFPSDSRLEYLADGSGRIAARPEHGSNSISLLSVPPVNQTRFHDGRLLVAPRHKFAFCFMEKVGCTQFNLLFNDLNNIGNQGRVWARSSALALGYNSSDITRENGWFKGVFLREPMNRLLSAHRSKCEIKDGWVEDGGSNCLGAIVNATDSAETRRENFRASLRMLQSYKGQNPHYVPMRSFCGGLSPSLMDYDYVGHLSGGYANVQRQVREMLAKAGIDFDKAKGSEYFPAVAPEVNHVTGASSVFNDYYNEPGDITGSLSHYIEDLELPGVATESFVAAATALTAATKD